MVYGNCGKVHASVHLLQQCAVNVGSWYEWSKAVFAHWKVLVIHLSSQFCIFSYEWVFPASCGASSTMHTLSKWLVQRGAWTTLLTYWLQISAMEQLLCVHVKHRGQPVLQHIIVATAWFIYLAICWGKLAEGFYIILTYSQSLLVQIWTYYHEESVKL
jgi:hypothetical protein